jgi:hypothetical protein
MKNILQVLIAFILTACLNAVEAEKEKAPGTEEPAPKAKILKEVKYNAQAVNKTVKEITKEIKKSKKEKKWMPHTKLANFYKIFHGYSKYADIELETGLYRKWYTRMYEALYRMSKASDMVESARFNKDMKLFNMANTEYAKGLNQFKNLSINKKKYLIPDDKLSDMKRAKRRKEREDRRKQRH